jgi:hypothetical protein
MRHGSLWHFADIGERPVESLLVPKADMSSVLCYVREVPEAGYGRFASFIADALSTNQDTQR